MSRSSLITPSFSTSPTVIRSVVDVDFTIAQIYNCSDATFISQSGDYLYLQNGSYPSKMTQIVAFENDILQASYWPAYQLRSETGIASWNRTLFISRYIDPYAAVEAVSFAKYSTPQNVSIASHYTTGGIPSISAYHSYIYMACQEWGFQIFDFSNISHPVNVGAVPLSTWHSRRLYVVSHFGLFIGDHQTGIFDLTTGRSPKKLWVTPKWQLYAHILSSSGRFAVSEKYFVINEDGTLVVFPFIDSSSIESPINISVSTLQGSSHCTLLDDDQVLLIACQNNTITVLDVCGWDPFSESSLHFSPLVEIYLGPIGAIKDLILTDRNDLYIADGANGLLKLDLNITRETLSSTTTLTTSNPSTTTEPITSLTTLPTSPITSPATTPDVVTTPGFEFWLFFFIFPIIIKINFFRKKENIT